MKKKDDVMDTVWALMLVVGLIAFVFVLLVLSFSLCQVTIVGAPLTFR